MTLGSASPATSGSFTQRAPFGAAVARGKCATKTVSSSGKCVNTWLTTPDSRRQFAFARKRGAVFGADARSKSCAHSLPGTSVMAPSRPFSGRWRSSTRPSARSATKAAPRRNFPSRLGALRGKFLLTPERARHANAVPRAERAGRPLGRANGGAEIHQRLREIAGAARRQQRRRQPLDHRLGRRQRLFYGKQPRHHALDIAVHRHRRGIERDRRDRRRGVVADAGQRAQRLD